MRKVRCSVDMPARSFIVTSTAEWLVVSQLSMLESPDLAGVWRDVTHQEIMKPISSMHEP